jgi:sugar/nucleoside kinase (ribokinase family)
MTMAPYDVLGLGCVAIDDLVYLADFPAPDTKMPIERHERQCGGLTATALVAAARLGARCVFAGVLGDDELSRFVRRRFEEEGIDTTLVRHRPEARPVHSTILVDQAHHTRTILYDLEGAFGAEPDWPDEDVIRRARVVFVDHFGTEGMIRAARIARAANIPVVADLERDDDPRFAELLALVDHLIVSQDFAARLAGQSHPAAAAEALWIPGRQAVVVTCGAEGGWYVAEASAGRGGRARRYAAFPVTAVDTTGCGDVFHGAYASALARGLGLAERLAFASAAAAIKATRHGGQAGIPTRRAVEEFLAAHSVVPHSS